MDLTSIELAGSVITAIAQENDELAVCFDPAYLIKSMTGSEERTKWRQAIKLVFTAARMEPLEDVVFPVTCTGGDVGENVYTYRDMIPVPLESRGDAHCDLTLEGIMQHIRITAEGVKLVREGTAKYIEHIR